MEINEMKQLLKKKKITYEKLAELTGYSKSCITKIFGGFAKYPRRDTIQAIERALEITENSPLEDGRIGNLTEKEKNLLNTFNRLNAKEQNFIIEMTEKMTDLSSHLENSDKDI